MAPMRLCELKCKTVINEKDCKILGHVVDIDFDEKTGCVNSLIVPGPAKVCGILGRDFLYIIPFKCVKNIGQDIIMACVCLDGIKQKCT